MNGIGKLTKPKRRRRYPIPDWCGETSWDYPFNNCPSRQRSTGTISAIIRRPPGFSRPDICFGLALVMASPLSVDRNQLMRGKKKVSLRVRAHYFRASFIRRWCACVQTKLCIIHSMTIILLVVACVHVRAVDVAAVSEKVTAALHGR
jgi:hypothetical protein